MTIEEKISKFYAIATETRNKSQKETQKDKRTGKKWTVSSAVGHLEV